ncbi:MAG: sulfite exporter TauE/SafE family protein [Polyangiaceae bacterium]
MNLGPALLLGLLGSAHCFSMCGPIAGAVGCSGCARGETSWKNVVWASLGRITTYTLLGALAGGLGYVLGSVLPGPFFRTLVRVFASLTILVAGLGLLGFGWPNAQLERAGAGLFRVVGPRFQRALRAGRSMRPWSVGFLWGLIPCGLVYSALALAVDSGTAFGGGTTLLAFGLATVPAPLAVGLFLQGTARSKSHDAIRRIGGVAAIMLGLLGVGREVMAHVPFELFPSRTCCSPHQAMRTP